MRISYEDATTFPFLRPEFIQQADFGQYINYVKEAVYSPRQLKIDGQKPKMSTLAHPLTLLLGIPKMKSRIYIYPRAFDPEFEENDFLSNLVEHEGEHARENYETPISLLKLIWLGKHKRTALKIESEKRAFLNQMRNMNKRQHSQKQTALILQGLNTGI
jgi:hypothetical protein